MNATIKPIRILIADDHQMMLDGLRSVLKTESDIHIVGEALNGKQVIQILASEKIDVAVIDISMPEMDGEETVLKMREEYPHTKVLILSFHKEEKYIRRLLKAGVAGYVIKDRGSKELVSAIKTIASGNQYFDMEVLQAGIRTMQNKHFDQQVKFTSRELDVINLIADGLSSRQIGEKLFIADSTVETHRKNLLEKLKLPNSKQLMKYAIDKGYGSTPLA